MKFDGREHKKVMKGRKQENGEAWLREWEAGKISLGKLMDIENKWCHNVVLSEQLNS